MRGNPYLSSLYVELVINKKKKYRNKYNIRLYDSMTKYYKILSLIFTIIISFYNALLN